MSNQLVGGVYMKIIDDVVENCQTTFEEDGINQRTLEDLRKTWQTKLSALKVGTFPWEPTPPPQPMVNPTVPSNVPRPQVQNSGPQSASPVPSNGAGGVRIKTEPGYDHPGYPPNGLPTTYSGDTVARQRAIANLQQKFPSASHPFNQHHPQAAMGAPGGQQQRGPMNIQLPPPMTDQQRQEQAEIKRRQQVQQYHNLQQAQQRPLVNNTQTDGAGDWDDYVASRRLAAAKNPGAVDEADLTIRQRVELMNRSMEGGGLMMPLAKQPDLPQVKKRKVMKTEAGSSSSYSSLVAAQTSDSKQMPRVPQLDGNDDDDDEDDKTGIKDELFDEDDEDAINSDLDDPDDNVIEEEQEEGRPTQIMLCTYDKVARVKNKWKCTLKDGVLTTGGREYVFHRAQGEFEW